MKNLSLIFTATVILVSCGNKPHNADGHIIIIDESRLNTEWKASDFFANITLVPLETSDNCLMSDVNKIVPVGDTLYLMDTKAGNIMMFDRKGRFIDRIRRMGRGPGEYLTLDDFTVTRSGKIMILDGDIGRLILLDSNGKYISQQTLPFAADALECIDDRLVVFNGSGFDDRVIIWDIQEKNIVASYIEHDTRYSTRIIKPLIKYGDEIYFRRDMSSTIYSVGDGELKEKWVIDFGERNIDIDNLVELPVLPGVLFNPPNTAKIDTFTETDKYVYACFQCTELSENLYHVYYSKSTDQQIYINADHYHDDMIFDKYPQISMSATSDGEFIDYLLPIYWFERMASYNPATMESEELAWWNALQDQLKDMNPFDNPVMVFYRLKDF